MEAAVKMGEVDEIHCNEGKIEGGVKMNGDISKESDDGSNSVPFENNKEAEESETTAAAETTEDDDDEDDEEEETIELSPEKAKSVDDDEEEEEEDDDVQEIEDDIDNGKDAHDNNVDCEEVEDEEEADDDEVVEVKDTASKNGSEATSTTAVNGETTSSKSSSSPDSPGTKNKNKEKTDKSAKISNGSAESDSDVEIADPLAVTSSTSGSSNSNKNKTKNNSSSSSSDSVDLNNSDDVVLVDEHKENGNRCTTPNSQQQDKTDAAQSGKRKAEGGDDTTNEVVINLDTPIKKKKKQEINTPPRRSSRNLNKTKSYIEEIEPEEDKNVESSEEDPDIEEVLPEDPLAVGPPSQPQPPPAHQHHPRKPRNPMHHITATSNSSTIVVSDTKRLVEIAANSKATSSGKKEPTLVIIDTNSILSGHGPVPINAQKQTATPPAAHQQSSAAQQAFAAAAAAAMHGLPMALPAQGVYPANMRATITPIPMVHHSSPQVSATVMTSVPKPAPQPPAQPVLPPPVLPTLTDDMYVVEAPSFIVPYVYEKPPLKDFKKFVEGVKKEIEEAERAREKEEEEREKKEPKSSDDKSDDKKDGSKEEDGEKSDKSADSSLEEKDKNDKKVDPNVTTIDVDELPDSTGDKAASASGAAAASTPPVDSTKAGAPSTKNSYFDCALGKFFIDIGFNLVQEFVQTDLLKQQKRKRDREMSNNSKTNYAIQALLKNLEYTKENNEPFRMELKKCEFCNFKTESDLVMAHHLETPHMKNYVYKCNFCPMEVRSPHEILFHMEAEHNVKAHLERAPQFHQCPNCTFEDNQKGKLSRHAVACARKFKPERNLEPPADWEPPAKIPRVPRLKQHGLGSTAAAYQAMAKTANFQQFLPKMPNATQVVQRGRGRPSLMGKMAAASQNAALFRNNMLYSAKHGLSSPVLVPTTYQLGGNQVYQVVGGQDRLSHNPLAYVPSSSTVTIQNSTPGNKSSSKPVHQPSISITPLPRAAPTPTSMEKAKAGDTNSKSSFVICEICDGYIKDLEQLRNHMQWIHKVKIHPKMIYNRPPLNCQKCQFRFFTDQGLERHLLGSHGLVTSSMQEAANKSKDSGRCPVCGRVYQWKLLNHVARDHNMTLKPAHLSYKCTVCTATFGMYKQFETHVYSAHSVVAKRAMDKKGGGSSKPPSSNDTLLKPLKINDEITIIPQPAKTKDSTSGSAKSSTQEGEEQPRLTRSRGNPAPTTSSVADSS